ncbi:MAG: pilus assembly protein [Lachnospiraceae bacterium]|nr:pilus assembly protein [Lachnospiraceae bacterium]
MRNRGSATVEACMVVPLFLFFMLAVSKLIMLLFAEAHIHQSLVEAAEYTAQYCYLEKSLLKDSTQTAQSLVNTTLLAKQFQTCLGEDFYVEKTIQNGRYGVLLTVNREERDDTIFVAQASYVAGIWIPVLGKYQLRLNDSVKKKAFVGYSGVGQEDIYVYVTPNREAYHKRRDCSHLSVHISRLDSTRKSGYKVCCFCGKENNNDGAIYVSQTGSVYHYRAGCSGLKRTVNRVKLSEVGGLPACQRCGG